MFICLSDLSALFKDLEHGKETFGGRIGINTILGTGGQMASRGLAGDSKMIQNITSIICLSIFYGPGKNV
ncbi:hypothetical protein DW241_14580 [Hungatella hathewayi]|nr:hypothetical protein DW241_14580 [Hungatella hathewayi]